MVFSQVAYPYIKAVSDPVHTGGCFSFFFFFFPHWWGYSLFSFSTLVGWFSFYFFPHWWGYSLFFFFQHWWGDSLVDAGHLHVEQGWSSSFFCQRDDRGKVSKSFYEKKYFMPSRARESGFGENHWIPNSTSSPKTSDMLQ